MKYKKNIFGNIEIKEENKDCFRINFEDNINRYIRRNIRMLHFLSGVFFVWDIFLFFECILNSPVKFHNRILDILVTVIVPFVVGFLKIFFCDPFCDTFSYKIKWFFMLIVFSVFGFGLWYIKSH